jgi:hypothetical protein
MTEISTPSQENENDRRRSVGRDARERLLSTVPLAERSLDLAGVSTAVLEGGDGPPIVLLHGPGEYAAKWIRVFPDLVRSYRVIAPDMPGHGDSKVSGPIEADRILEWLGALIEHTCPTPPALIGQILGGAPKPSWRGPCSPASSFLPPSWFSSGSRPTSGAGF